MDFWKYWKILNFWVTQASKNSEKSVKSLLFSTFLIFFFLKIEFMDTRFFKHYELYFKNMMNNFRQRFGVHNDQHQRRHGRQSFFKPSSSRSKQLLIPYLFTHLRSPTRRQICLSLPWRIKSSPWTRTSVLQVPRRIGQPGKWDLRRATKWNLYGSPVHLWERNLHPGAVGLRWQQRLW